MPVTVSVKDLLNCMPALREFGALDVPVKLSFKIQRIMKKIQAEATTAGEAQQALGTKHAEKDADGEPVHPKDDKGVELADQLKLADAKAFQADLKELLAQEVTLGFDPLKPSELGEKIDVKPGVLLALHWLFTDE